MTNRILHHLPAPPRAAAPAKPAEPVVVSNAECPRCGGAVLYSPDHGLYCATAGCHGTGPFGPRLVLVFG